MARSHHRKKHKEHLRQFKQGHDSAASSSTAKGKVTPIFILLGAAAGFAVSYFATGGSNLIWIFAGVLAGAGAGYYTGRKIDSDK